ncbi:BrnT family toxin [Zavarzinia compransoris]|uniref:BrnT family toxin n=1 Tax=Zavarzinia marina TaxID=2911065 RepID=UPI001F3A759D|nr:BrnT family toxin [Zavarzinia marina]MCF4165115.1 BrnT family toxin [Zavarzinia marina]
MLITYDDAKREANIAKHGLDFEALVDGVFFETALVRPARNGRFMAIGRLADGTISVVFARLGAQGISIISMRPASVKERKLLS